MVVTFTNALELLEALVAVPVASITTVRQPERLVVKAD